MTAAANQLGSVEQIVVLVVREPVVLPACWGPFVTNSYRIANRLDIVPTLPPPVDYEHVLNPSELNPIRSLPLPPKVLVKFDPGCEHSLQTYLYLLSLQSGGAILPLESTLPTLSEISVNSG
jgi:hypothetical protein